MAYTSIDDPSAYFHTQLYSGDGGGSNAITNDANAGDFKPDWLWIKERTATSSNTLVDSTRGAGNILLSDSTNAEASAPAVSSLNTDGFTLGSDGKTNEVSQTYVAWQWKANGGTTSTNSDGTVNTTMQLNSTAGFSIITWTGNGSSTGTVGHGLGAIPDCIIVKKRENTSNWSVAFPKFETSKLLALNLTSAFFTASGLSSYNSSTFVDGSGASSEDTVAYCFKNIQGYSKFGSYTGNGNADGPMVFCGFKPAWVMIKSTSVTQGWGIWDNKRTPSNLSNKILIASSSTSELTGFGIDILSNGFKLRSTDANSNQSGATYIYMAFGETFVSSEGVPCTAR